MFGFHSFRENPFSSLSGGVKTGVAALSASGAFDSNIGVIHGGSISAIATGQLIPDMSLIHGGFAAFSASGSLTSNGSIIAPGSSLILDAGTVTANGTLALTSDSLLETSGNLTANLRSITVTVHSGVAILEASGSLTSNDSVAVAGSGLILNAGTITANGTLVIISDSLLEASGEISSTASSAKSRTSLLVDSGTVSANGTLLFPIASTIEASGALSNSTSLIRPSAASINSSGNITSDNSLIITSDSTLSASGEFTSDGKVFKAASAQISSSGTLGSIGTFKIAAGGGNLESPGATIVAGKFATGKLTASLSASATVTGQISTTLNGQAVIGTKTFVKKTSRPNYKPALPKLSSKDVVLDFPFHEGAGNLRSVSSRRQSGNIGNLSWSRADGIQSLYSPGLTFQNNRITTDTTGIKFDKAGIILKFKPTRNTTAREFLFTIRGTANNNNEIDCYTRTANGKVYVKIYNGTSEQVLQIPNLVVDTWNTLVVTWGGGDLKGSLNGNEFSTYSSVTVPHTALVDKTLYLFGTSSDTLIPMGHIGAFRWYNRELSSIEARQLHKNIYKDYSLDYIIPLSYEACTVGGVGTIVKDAVASISGSGQVVGRGVFLLAHIKSVFGGEAQLSADGIPTEFRVNVASLQAIATIAANGLLLGELDTVSFNVFINRLEDYNVDVYRQFVKEFNVARLKTVSTSIEQTKITDINIDKILETGLEK